MELFDEILSYLDEMDELVTVEKIAFEIHKMPVVVAMALTALVNAGFVLTEHNLYCIHPETAKLLKTIREIERKEGR